jgi:hypothetical protein
MATAISTLRSTTRMSEPTRTQISKTAQEIRQAWTPAECRRRREQAHSAQRRLFCLAFAIAA